MKISEEALELAVGKLQKLRLTTGWSGRPALTVKKCLKLSLGDKYYKDTTLEYILRFGLKYYQEALDSLEDS